MSRISRRWLLCVAAVVGSGLACGGDDAPGPEITGVSAQITVRDTILLVGDTASFFVKVQYVFGPGVASNVFWTLSDTTAVSLDIFANATGSSDGSSIVAAKRPGTAKLIALINNKFTDTATITVVAPGTVKWRQALTAFNGVSPALDDSDNVYALTNSTLVSFTSAGASRSSVASCFNLFSPSVRADGSAVVVTGGVTGGTTCTERHNRDGTAAWTAPLGSPDGGVALTANDGVVVLASLGTTTGAVVVSRFDTQGLETWRDILRPIPLEQKSSPAIAVNGDIYVPWRAPAESSWVSRISGVGARLWTVPLPDYPRYTSPAIDSNRIYVAYGASGSGSGSGLSALDTAGTIVWSVQTGGSSVSSPVIDAAGNVYLQAATGLRSYSSGGTLRWVADSLATGGAASQTGSPTILANGTLVVPCNGEVCEVRVADGSLVWRSAVSGGVSGTLGVGSDGTIYLIRATASAAEVVALWSRAIPLKSGWPTEGHDAQRSRRQF